ncbi:phosphoheptose isomerase, partial [Campylobacter jejuni]|nr:phosphoheptose isomerase [Campylobacter jejuni]
MENLNSYIKEHFQESILVKEQILKDENLIT